MHHHNSLVDETVILENTGLKGWVRANKTKFVLASAIFLAVLVSSLTSLSVSDAEAASTCDKVASSNVQGLIDSLRPGQTGCLRKGVYTKSSERVAFKNSGKQGSRIVLRSYPGEKATLRGSIYIPDGKNYITVRSMRLDASYGPVGPGHFKNDRNTDQAVDVRGDNVNILYNNITNRRPGGNPDLAGTCIFLGSFPNDTLIKGNRIHRCGEMPRINREHGIYASHPRGATIKDNLIYDNADRGIQLYPDAQGVLVSGNVLFRNAVNLLISANSSRNTVRNNVLSHPADDWNVNMGTELFGSGNRVTNNCLWAPGGKSALKKGGKNSVVARNIVRNPRYQFKGGFKIMNRACLAKYSGTLAR